MRQSQISEASVQAPTPCKTPMDFFPAYVSLFNHHFQPEGFPVKKGSEQDIRRMRLPTFLLKPGSLLR